MQKNDQEKQVVEKPIIVGIKKFLGLLGEFFGFLKKLFLQSNLWSFSLFILFLLFFISDAFRDKYSGWFFDSVGKITGKSSMSNDYSIHGSVDATVSRPFKDAAQACWYYHANYENSHPYTVLWKKSKVEDGYPKIRVIAEKAYWQAEKCTKEKSEVKLIGIEYTKHSIEAQFKENKGFELIATSDAYYRSALSFDKAGRITERRVLESDFEYEYESESEYSHLCYALNKVQKKEDRCDRVSSLEPKKFQDLKKKKNEFNSLKIASNFDPDKNSIDPEEYRQAIILYIKERENLHTELSRQGCGAISIEPELVEDSGNLFNTSIAFLCFKESGSHVRLMHRVSKENF